DEGNCSLSCLLLPCGGADHHLNLLSFPTRRSSDLACRALPGSIVDRSATTLPGRAANGPSAAASTCSGLGRERTTTSAPLRASSAESRVLTPAAWDASRVVATGSNPVTSWPASVSAWA